jgi:integrase/recombinase XerD
MTKPILERYQRHLYHYRKSDGQPLTLSSQQMMLTPLKTFFKWLARNNHILYNPASELEIPKKTHRLPRYILTLDELERVFGQPDLDTAAGIRDRALLETCYATGMRRMELVNLKLHDLDPRRAVVLIREGKGREDRVVPISSRALGWIRYYLHETRPALLAAQDTGHVFLTDWGAAFKRGYLTALVKRYLRQADIETAGACHLFRHALATHLLENGADVRFIQTLLGHRDINTTQIYTRVSIERLRSIYEAALPLGREVSMPGEGSTEPEASRSG